MLKTSKYRNIYCEGGKKEHCFLNVKPSLVPGEGNMLAVSTSYVAVLWESYGGGAFATYPTDLSVSGARSGERQMYHGHQGPITDLHFSPHNDHLLCTGGEDGHVYLWHLPDHRPTPLTRAASTPTDDAHRHTRKVTCVLFHDASTFIASAGADGAVKVWDYQPSPLPGSPLHTLQGHTDIVQSLAWHRQDNLLVTASRDKWVRLYDPRASNAPQQSLLAHHGIKGTRVCWINDRYLLTTGFDRAGGERRMLLWDARQLHASQCLVDLSLGFGAGMPTPYFDTQHQLLYVVPKGDRMIHIFDHDSSTLSFQHLSDVTSSEPHRGIAFIAPNRHGLSPSSEEDALLNAYSLHGNFIEPLGFHLPRKIETLRKPSVSHRSKHKTAADQQRHDEKAVSSKSATPLKTPTTEKKSKKTDSVKKSQTPTTPTIQRSSQDRRHGGSTMTRRYGAPHDEKSKKEQGTMRYGGLVGDAHWDAIDLETVTLNELKLAYVELRKAYRQATQSEYSDQKGGVPKMMWQHSPADSFKSSMSRLDGQDHDVQQKTGFFRSLFFRRHREKMWEQGET